MKKVKSLLALLLVAVFMVSFLCACDGSASVKLDKEVDAFLDGFFETLFEAVEEMDSEKIIPYWYIPEKYKDFENVKEQVTTITKENIKRILRQDYPKPNKIVYTACTTNVNEERNVTIYNIDFVLKYKEKEYEGTGSVTVLMDHISGTSGIAYIRTDLPFFQFNVEEVLKDCVIDYDGFW